MKKDEWLTPEEASLLRKQGAPMKLVRALGSVPRLRHSLLNFDFTEPQGVFTDLLQHRSKGLAQRGVFELVEALTPYLGDPVSVPNFAGIRALCREWRCVPGWALSVSAEYYSGDSDWCDIAIVIHRRLPDEQSRKLMDRNVKVALWGDDEEGWPRPYSFTTPPPVLVSEPKPLPDWVIELEQLSRPDHGLEADVEEGHGPTSLHDLFR